MISAGWGYTGPAWLGVELAGGAIGVGLVSYRLDRRETAEVGPRTSG